MKHTKGPWIMSGISGRMIQSKDKEGTQYFIADVDIIDNARLISCAPEMLDCLIDGMKHNIEHGCLKKCSYTFRSPFCDKCNKMKSILVIEKATGLKIEEVLKNV